MKTNKMLLLGIVALSAVILGGCAKEKIAIGSKSDNAVAKPENKEQVAGMDVKIAKALDAGRPVYCVMTGPDGGKVESWTKGKKTKVRGMNMGGDEGMGYMISDGEWTYVWTDGSKKGTKLPVMAENEPEESEPEMPNDDDMNFDIQQQLADDEAEGFKHECKEQNISDSIFVPPTDVEFVDMMANMKLNLK